MTARRLVAQDQRIGLAAVDQRHGDAGIGHVEQAALPFDDIPVILPSLVALVCQVFLSRTTVIAYDFPKSVLDDSSVLNKCFFDLILSILVLREFELLNSKFAENFSKKFCFASISKKWTVTGLVVRFIVVP